jgi:hypothetical protein
VRQSVIRAAYTVRQQTVLFVAVRVIGVCVCVMACVNQTRPHYVNQMGKTQSNDLAERHGRGTAGERHGMCESAFSLQSNSILS